MSSFDDELIYCSFCGNEPDPMEGRILIQGLNGVHICTHCVDEIKKTVSRYQSYSAPKSLLKNKDIKPSKILEHLNQYVVGQEHAKMVLSVAVYNHYKFLEYKSIPNPPVEVEKSNICLVGPTGSGKTYMVKQIAKILDVPFAIADATTLTEAGYVGEDVESVIQKLYDAADGDIEKTERGIVYIDEIDKLSRKSKHPQTNRDVGGEGVQQALLKMIEGTEVAITEKGMRKGPMSSVVHIDTSNILFIVGGSFEGIEEVIRERQNKNIKTGIGFNAPQRSSKEEKTFNELILDIRAEDLRNFGMIPEFIGRLPVICPMTELGKEELIRILTEPKNAIVKQYQEMFKLEGVDLRFTKEALEEIAEEAIKRKTGARSLRSIMEEVLLKHMFHIPDDRNIRRLTFTAGCVTEKKDPIVEYDEQKEIESNQ